MDSGWLTSLKASTAQGLCNSEQGEALPHIKARGESVELQESPCKVHANQAPQDAAFCPQSLVNAVSDTCTGPKRAVGQGKECPFLRARQAGDPTEAGQGLLPPLG